MRKYLLTKIQFLKQFLTQLFFSWHLNQSSQKLVHFLWVWSWLDGLNIMWPRLILALGFLGGTPPWAMHGHDNLEISSALNLCGGHRCHPTVWNDCSYCSWQCHSCARVSTRQSTSWRPKFRILALGFPGKILAVGRWIFLPSSLRIYGLKWGSLLLVLPALPHNCTLSIHNSFMVTSGPEM